VLLSITGDECIPRSFGNNSIVCVCNSTYCDTVNKQKLQQNQLLWYTSTQDGKRMQLSVMNFSAKNESEIDLILTVDIDQKFQKIQGFGGAMTDAAALNIRSLSNKTQQILLEYVIGIIN
ncbi:Glucosylceramidase, partial [Trachymyrmex septentrionalis]